MTPLVTAELLVAFTQIKSKHDARNTRVVEMIKKVSRPLMMLKGALSAAAQRMLAAFGEQWVRHGKASGEVVYTFLKELILGKRSDKSAGDDGLAAMDAAYSAMRGHLSGEHTGDEQPDVQAASCGFGVLSPAQVSVTRFDWGWEASWSGREFRHQFTHMMCNGPAIFKPPLDSEPGEGSWDIVVNPSSKLEAAQGD